MVVIFNALICALQLHQMIQKDV